MSVSHSLFLPKVHNVKIRLKLPTSVDIPDHLSDGVVRHNNFISMKVEKYSCIIFLKSGHVNISGIKDFADIKEAVCCFNRHFGTDVQEDNIIIDNSTASGQLSCKSICLPKLRSNPLCIEGTITVSIRPHYFPSALIRQTCKSHNHKQSNNIAGEKLSTIILFANGKFNIVGCKSESAIHKTWIQLCAIIQSQ